MTTPIIGASSPIDFFKISVVFNTLCSGFESFILGGFIFFICSISLITGSPEFGGPASVKTTSPPNASISIGA